MQTWLSSGVGWQLQLIFRPLVWALPYAALKRKKKGFISGQLVGEHYITLTQVSTGWRGHCVEPDVAEATSKTVNLTPAPKGLFPEVTCVSFALTSLTRVSH